MDALATEYANRSAVFLEQSVDAPLGDRISRWWAAYGSGASVYLPLVMVDSGRRISNGSQSDFAAAYRALVEAELVRPPKAEIEAYARMVGAKVRVYARLRNASGTALSAANKAALHALVWEDRRVGVTGRIVRAAPWIAIAPQVPPDGEFTATLETPDLSGVNLNAVHTVVVADYVPGPGSAYDMLQGAVADPVGLLTEPEEVTVALDANAPKDRSVPVTLRGPYVLSWTAATDAPWVTVTPNSGAVSTQPAVTVTAGRLSPGWQHGAVTFSASSQDGMSFAQTIGVSAFSGSRVLRVGTATACRGANVTLQVALDALGDESAVSFSVVFDPTVLSGPFVSAGADASMDILTVDESQAASGRLGIALALPAGRPFDQGEHQLVSISFAVSSGAVTSTTTVGFADQPVALRVVDSAGGALSATYLDGAVAVAAAPPVRPPRRHFTGGTP